MNYAKTKKRKTYNIRKIKTNKKFKKILKGGGYYKNLRLALDNGDDNISIFQRARRRGTDKYHNISERAPFADYTFEYSLKTAKQKRDHKRLIDKHRNELKRNFNPQGILLSDIIDDYHTYGLDQGAEGACSFVGFLNLILINGIDNEILNDDVISNWRSYWEQFQKDTSTDIAETLDDMFEYNCFKENAENYINYVPMRSENHNENYHNVQFWSDEYKICEYFGIDKDEYDTLPWLFQQAYYIEDLLNKGIPIEINAREHSRTCVSFNDNYLLFADNWGHEGYEQSWNDSLEDNFFGGFSTANKWGIYSCVRDIVWINNQDNTNQEFNKNEYNEDEYNNQEYNEDEYNTQEYNEDEYNYNENSEYN